MEGGEEAYSLVNLCAGFLAVALEVLFGVGGLAGELGSNFAGGSVHVAWEKNEASVFGKATLLRNTRKRRGFEDEGHCVLSNFFSAALALPPAP